MARRTALRDALPQERIATKTTFAPKGAPPPLIAVRGHYPSQPRLPAAGEAMPWLFDIKNRRRGDTLVPTLQVAADQAKTFVEIIDALLRDYFPEPFRFVKIPGSRPELATLEERR